MLEPKDNITKVTYIYILHEFSKFSTYKLRVIDKKRNS